MKFLIQDGSNNLKNQFDDYVCFYSLLEKVALAANDGKIPDKSD